MTKQSLEHRTYLGHTPKHDETCTEEWGHTKQNKTEKHDETCKTMVQKESELFDKSIKTMKGTKDKQKITWIENKWIIERKQKKDYI